ncbi:hypothetical protein [Pleomorphomonas oryzae]|uniref:hypothetical protein n=1 Tax=Pleomorphomonas oryzae TaxID=261934 RepID=UPI00047CC2D8|nr:hypothetical protein [Pleomorphomonas oryzae]
MKLNSRRDQLSFFLGYVSRLRREKLREAEDYIEKIGHKNFSTEDVFEFCPFNDTQDQIDRSYNIFENGKGSDFVFNLSRLLEEYFFLFSDFEPPCCGDARTFYGQDRLGHILLCCDRCGETYALDGSPTEEKVHKRMSKIDFLSLFGEQTEGMWPFRIKVYELLLR